jgi:hypothetical protein
LITKFSEKYPTEETFLRDKIVCQCEKNFRLAVINVALEIEEEIIDEPPNVNRSELKTAMKELLGNKSLFGKKTETNHEFNWRIGTKSATSSSQNDFFKLSLIETFETLRSLKSVALSQKSLRKMELNGFVSSHT